MPLPETVYIYYGSEMGTGEGFAEDLSAALTKNGIKNTVMDIDEFEEEDIVNQEVCIFFFSTYGNGMPTRSSRAFFAWMKSNCGDNTAMAKVHYAMFGLGDHNYPRYQAASILADQQLQKMGAHPIMELRKGDAAEDIDGDFEAWQADVIAALKAY
ncbi:P450 reductase [Blastocystis sp. ATCC 50177/Nand II]|uniref:p450 reductase n=1 Tax=Blastocystis sp. subtype 1 (strain ATCC 50177 / NandII) TaxID=478820 RepID=A0A196SAJ3_BLAHN|nr:P450 reductase [Blastocystis sp. ATCC 50177/Nand II]